MNFVRPILLATASALVFLAGGCATPPPPLVRQHVVYEPPPPPAPPRVAVMIASETATLSNEAAEQRRPQILDYLREREFLQPDDEVVPDAVSADRIIRVAVQDDGSYRVDVFEPRDDRASGPEIGAEDFLKDRYAPPPTIYRYRRYYRDPFDPFVIDPLYPRYYDPYPSFGFYYRSYRPHRYYPRPVYPRHYQRPVLPPPPQHRIHRPPQHQRPPQPAPPPDYRRNEERQSDVERNQVERHPR